MHMQPTDFTASVLSLQLLGLHYAHTSTAVHAVLRTVVAAAVAGMMC
jgi:hypothetical protein